MEKKDDNTVHPNNDKKIEESNIKKPKKRGRKPKNLSNPTVPKKSIKKEKKRKEKIGNHDFGMVEKDTSGLSTEHLILHLKINTHDSKFKPNHQTEQDLLAYTPELNEPLPYEMLPSDSYPCPLINPLEGDPSNNIESTKVLNSTKEDKKIQKSIHNIKKDEKNKESIHSDLEYTEDGKRKWMSENNCSQIINKNNYQNLSSFQQKSEKVNKSVTDVPVHHLPPITDINCWWCCHSFTWNPFVLPIAKESNKVYRSIGCFCCPECCAAYIFESGKRYGEPWKQYSLLHEMISREISGKNVHIKLAPPRETLHIFGGPYTIQQYRNLSENYQMDVKITMPPINPMNGVTEEMMVEYITKKTFVPLDHSRIQKATQELRLKRQKKKNTENTLETFMQLKIT